MSDSDKSERTAPLDKLNYWLCWGFFAAVIIAVFLQIACHKPSASQQEYQAHCHEAKTRYYVILNQSLKPFSADENTEDGKHEKKGREQVTYWCDLFAQQTAADAARYAVSQSLWVTLLTGFGVLLVGGTLVYTAKTLAETEKTTKAVVAEQRARIIIKLSQKESLSLRDKGSLCDIDCGVIEIKNIGKNIATNVHIFHRSVTIINAKRSYEEFRKVFNSEIEETRPKGKMILTRCD